MNRSLWMAAALLLACGGSNSPSTIAQVTEAASISGQYTYAFDPAGLSTSVGTGGASYAIVRHGDTLTAGTDAYTFDALGRVIAIDARAVAYGPDGQIDHATSGAHAVAYVYDEDGQRILKSSDGTPIAAYVDGVVVTATELDEPVTVAGHHVGILRNGRFALTAGDLRGTVQADTDGTSRLASPFGARPVHPDVAATVDYADKGFDADLGADRMGVRDYDARIARFLEPDPLFLLEPDRCVKSPWECNLYGYARNRPLDFIDPSGTDTHLVAHIDPASLKGTMTLVNDEGTVLWESRVSNQTNRATKLSDVPEGTRERGSNMPLRAGLYPIGAEVVSGSHGQFPTGALVVKLPDGKGGFIDQGIRIHNDWKNGSIADEKKAIIERQIAAGHRGDYEIKTNGCFRTEQVKQEELVKIARDEMPANLMVVYDKPAGGEKK